MSIGKRIQQIRIENDLGQAELAALLDIHPNTLRQYEQDKSIPDAVLMRRLSQEYNIDVAWLIGVDPHNRVEITAKRVRQFCEVCELYAYIRKAKAKLSAGGGWQAEEGFAKQRFGFLRSWLHQKATAINDETLFLIDVEGDSMLDTFASGDMVLVDTGRKELRKEGHFAIGEGEWMNIKRLQREDDLIHIISDNKDKALYPTRTVQGETVNIIGRVIWLAREIP